MSRLSLFAWCLCLCTPGCAPVASDGIASPWPADAADGLPSTTSDAAGEVDAGRDGAGPDAGPPAGADTTQGEAGFGSLQGTVWAPGNAPSMVPVGQEIPVYGAVVYLTEERPAPIPQQAYCEACGGAPPRAVFTDHRGAFVLSDRPAGSWWLVIQKGQFRIETRVVIEPGVSASLAADVTTLPSRHEPEAGRWIPRIALATGHYDRLEDVLAKMGMGTVDAEGSFLAGVAGAAIDVWTNGGRSLPGVRGSLGELVRDIRQLSQYHIVFIPCSDNANTAVLREQAVLNNIRQYVAHGGNLYVTDWSGEWVDAVFPAAMQLGDLGADTPADAYDATHDVWHAERFGSADGAEYDSPDGEAVDPGLLRWLDGQLGPTALSAEPSVFDASRFYIEGNWNFIEAAPPYPVPTSGAGTTMDQARVFVRGSGSGFFGSPDKKPLTITFEPAGCGRALYSTYHTTNRPHLGLAPQERVLLYLIMEIGTCRFPKG